MKKLILLIIISSLIQFHSGYGFDQDKFRSLTVEKDQTIIIDQDSVLFDTLVMESASKLKFLRDAVVIVRHAYFDENVTFDLQGDEGKDGEKGTEFNPKGEDGGAGGFGKNIELIIEFEKLGSFTINTSGGNGGRGGNGYTPKQNWMKGENGKDGGDSGAGGIGQSGGQIELSYLSTDFIPLINKNGDHSINLVTKSGECGGNGRPGRGGQGGERQNFVDAKGVTTVSIPRGKSGRPGSVTGHCRSGVDGEIVLKKLSLEIN